jgi:hypothetical protein
VVVVILTPFPPPPPVIEETLTVLEILRSGDEQAIAELGDVTDLPRPWDPPTCPPEIRDPLWHWLDDVAAWINREYAWRPAQMIPPCWPAHPHLARELPVLACLRMAAGRAVTADLMEDWHRYALPYFLERMVSRLEGSSCRNGQHSDWPSAARHDHYTGEGPATERLDAYWADTHPPTPLRTAR